MLHEQQGRSMLPPITWSSVSHLDCFVSHHQALKPVEFEGVKGVSFGFAGQGSAIMRGAMVSGDTPPLDISRSWPMA